jgi:LysM repeat protein
VVPGISYHHAVHGDTDKTIAEQHGVTDTAVQKANPLISNWATLRAGESVLIPAH